MLDTVLVARSFETPVDLGRLEAAQLAAGGCFTAHRVTFVRTFAAEDGRRLLCQYQAPDAEAVRATQLEAGLPHERIWTTAVLQHAPPLAPADHVHVVVERELGVTVTGPMVSMSFEEQAPAFGARRVIPLASYLSVDGRSLVCHMVGPSADAVDTANRAAGMAVTRCWPAQIMYP